MIVLYPLLLMVPGLDWEAGLDRERGLIENLTALLLAAALWYFMQAARRPLTRAHRAWLLLLGLGALFFLGEEISWGQHYLGWETPGSLRQLNRQAETNLHNLRGGLGFFFSRGCSAALSLAVVVAALGGLWAAWRGRGGPAWLWPPAGCALAAFLSAAVRVPRLLAEADGMEALPPLYGIAMGELKECLQALFILLYALAQRRLAASCHEEFADTAACA